MTTSTTHHGLAVSAAEFRDAIGRFLTGVTVVTSRHEGAPQGITASAVCSVSLEPPMLLVCLNRQSSTRHAVAGSGRFAVNVLADGQQDLAMRFATKSADKFAGLTLAAGEDDLPLLEGALATLECRVTEEANGGTHSIFIATVERATVREGSPLAYVRGRFARVQPLGDA
jgi:flavin reductase (DIM6/NTAB) family NADH-FMN oxidoreductase RutF